MKVSEFRKLIREEVRKVLKEATGEAYALILDKKNKKFSQLDLSSFWSKYAKQIIAVLKDPGDKLSAAKAARWPVGGNYPEWVKAVSTLKGTSDFYIISVEGHQVIAAIPKGESMKTYAGPFAGEDESTGSAGSVSASQLKDGIGLPFDEGKLAAKFIKRANELGMKQGPNESTTSDYCFSFEYGDGAMEGEMIVLQGTVAVGEKTGDEAGSIHIMNPKMQKDPTIQKLAQKAIEQYDGEE